MSQYGKYPPPPSQGSVDSVGLSASSIFIVGGSPVTSTGTLTLALAPEPANTVLAGPTSGSPAVPTFRALVSADIPSLSGTYLPLAGGTMSGAIVFPGMYNSDDLATGSNISIETLSADSYDEPALSIQSADTSDSTHMPSDIELLPGDSTDLSFYGGASFMFGGNGLGGGNCTMLAGTGQGGGGGACIINAGEDDTGGGGLVAINSGNSTGGTGGAIYIISGNGSSVSGGQGGRLIFEAGSGYTGGANYFIAGDGSGGGGGAVTFEAGNDYSGGTGGNIILTPGAGTTAGNLQLLGAVQLGAASTTLQHSLNTLLGTNASGVGTLTNLPTGKSGNPTGYISINLNGTTRYIPFW